MAGTQAILKSTLVQGQPFNVHEERTAKPTADHGGQEARYVVMERRPFCGKQQQPYDTACVRVTSEGCTRPTNRDHRGQTGDSLYLPSTFGLGTPGRTRPQGKWHNCSKIWSLFPQTTAGLPRKESPRGLSGSSAHVRAGPGSPPSPPACNQTPHLSSPSNRELSGPWWGAGVQVS